VARRAPRVYTLRPDSTLIREKIMTAKSSKAAAASTMSNVNTDPIREFYTNHPYPPPLENLDRAIEMWKDENVHRAEFHLLWPDKEYRADLAVLVAGCGTWQAAKYALTHPTARVMAIDISPTSLEHTERLKQKYEMTNIETRQLAIENVAELDQRFDLIICTGVLHHLVDPDAGLRALRSVLKPEGAMYLMLYAPYGRAGIYMIQEYCRRLGIGTSREEIDDLTAILRQLPQHHPLIATFRGERNLDAHALTDALLNPRERAYSVPELLDFLERSDLKLSRWYWQAAYLPQCGGMSQTPHAERIAKLSEREQYAAMELWRGLMTIHSIAVHPSDYNGEKIRFDDESYLRYVPIRLPWTICGEQQLPPGAAGVLINQTHVFNDLFVIIDPQQRQMFEAIDGRRSISEIVESVEGSSSRAREFFEQLWWYDQVVFDTSK
jgi:SAM-dependent methyltransferase